MNAPLAFIDTETTGVHHGRRAWEIAIIRRDTTGTERTFHAFVGDVDLSDADPFGLKIGRFYERHPAYNTTSNRADTWAHDYSFGPVPAGAQILNEMEVVDYVERLTRGAHLVGAVPNFDAEVFADMLRRHQLTPAWHYHLIDVEALAVGWIHGSGRVPNIAHQLGVELPWKSDDLSRACGVEPAGDDERHTALGDARWAMRLYDAIVSAAVTR